MYKSHVNSKKDEFQTFRMCVLQHPSSEFFPKDNFNEMQMCINKYKGGLLIAITSSSRMVVLLNCGWMTYKSQLVLMSLLHTII